MGSEFGTASLDSDIMQLDFKPITLNYRDLCNANESELSGKLQRASGDHESTEVTAQLLQAVEMDLLPGIVLTTWVGMTRDPQHVVHALACHNRFVRSVCIHKIGQWLRSVRWQRMFTALGGVQGIVDLMSTSCLDDVKALIKALRRSLPVGGRGGDPRRHLFTDLFKSLCNKASSDSRQGEGSTVHRSRPVATVSFPDASCASRDGRHLQHLYLGILPVCTSDFVLEMLAADTTRTGWAKTILCDHALVLHHSATIEEAILSGLSRDSDFDMTIRKFLPFLLRQNPGTSGREKWSHTMEFSLRVLRELSSSKCTDFGGQVVMFDLVRPLLHRLRHSRRHESWQGVFDVVSAATAYAQVDSMFAELLDVAFLSDVVWMWTHDPARGNALLISVLERMAMKKSAVKNIDNALSAADLEHRYHLTKLVFRYLFKPALDIEGTASLRTWIDDKRIKDNEFVSAFNLLPRVERLALLDRLIAANGSDALDLPSLPYNFGGFYPLAEEPDKCDVRYLRITLQEPSAKLSSDVQEAVLELKDEASKATDQEKRGAFASAVMEYGIASQDFGIYQDCLQWSRRFLRDPSVYKPLFKNAHWGEGLVRLLSGVDVYQSKSVDDLRGNVAKGNDMLRLWTEIACDSLREAHFKHFMWRDLTDCLVRSVVNRRITAASELATRLALGQEDLFDAIFVDTLSVLVELQKVGLNEEYSRLCLLQDTVFESAREIRTIAPAAWRFVDELAQARDGLWAQARLAQNPEVASLPAIWPRGLPLRFHLGFDTEDLRSAGRNIPYLERRAKDIVFASSSVANAPFPTGKEQQLIGIFRDAYSTALCIYVFSAVGLAAQAERLREARHHAMTELCADIGTQEWSQVRWTKTFRELSDHFDSEKGLLDEVRAQDFLPTPERQLWSVQVPDDDGTITEWNPAAHLPDIREDVHQDASTIDMLLHPALYAPERYAAPAPFLSTLSHSGPGSALQIFISSESPARLTRPGSANADLFPTDGTVIKAGKEIEGRIACAILWLDLQKEGAASVLLKGFPVVEDGFGGKQRRFPPLLLDPDFRLDEEPSIGATFSFLHRNDRRVPLRLVYTLAEEAFTALKSMEENAPQQARVEEVLFESLAMVAGAPYATSLICKALFELPSSSSWYRRIVNRRLLNRLSPHLAHEFVLSLVARIFELNSVYREQYKAVKSLSHDIAPKQRDDFNSEPQVRPTVKVTTFKMVAQLLENSTIFPPHVAMTLLGDILGRDPHPDVRDAAINSVCRLLATTSSMELDRETQRLAQGLVKSWRPTIAALDERIGAVTSRSWDVTQDLPRIQQDRPLFNMLVKYCTAEKMPRYWREYIIGNVLVPAVEDNILLHKEWLQRFHQKYATEGSMWDDIRYPNATVNKSMLRTVILSFPQHTTKSLLQLWQRWNLAITVVARKDADTTSTFPQTRIDPAAKRGPRQQWHSAFTPVGGLINEANQLFSILCKPWHSQVHQSSIRISDVQDCILGFMEAALDHPDLQPSLAQSLASTLSYGSQLGPWNPRCSGYSTWKLQCAPIVRRIISQIDARRTPEWQKNPSRCPAWLPDTFQLRTFLWRFPEPPTGADRSENVNDHDLDELLQDVMREWRGFIAAKALWTDELDRTTALLEAVLSDEQQDAFSRTLGRLPTSEAEDPKEMVVRVKLAAKLLEGRGKEAKAIAAVWLQSEIEEVRASAWTLISRCED